MKNALSSTTLDALCLFATYGPVSITRYVIIKLACNGYMREAWNMADHLSEPEQSFADIDFIHRYQLKQLTAH